jgi:hypothetical protein
LDIQALQAKLAAQEARLNDLQAKIGGGSGGTAANVTSLNKNARVTIGGTVATRYIYHSGSVKAYDDVADDGSLIKAKSYKAADLKVSDAVLRFNVGVNDYFDAFLQLNFGDDVRRGGVLNNGGNQLRDVADGNAGIHVVQNAWVRWKNLCNSGFGIKIGRDALVFGAGNQAGLQQWGWIGGNGYYDDYGNGAFGRNISTAGLGNIHSSMFLTRSTGINESRTTQITPYWEGLDGKVKLEVSLFQYRQTFDGGRYGTSGGATAAHTYDSYNIRSINYGLGSASTRLTVAPIEGLKLSASAINYYAKEGLGWNNFATLSGNSYQYFDANSVPHAVNYANSITAVNLGFDYKLACLPRLRLFGQWTHGWNEAHVKDRDSDVVSLGFAYNITEQLKFITQGEYLSVRDGVNYYLDGGNITRERFKTKGWAIYPAIVYSLPYGVNFEVGYRYEQVKTKDEGETVAKGKMHTVYGQVGFSF